MKITNAIARKPAPLNALSILLIFVASAVCHDEPAALDHLKMHDTL